MILFNLKIPSWLKKDYIEIQDVQDIPVDYIERIKTELKDKQPENPVISIGVIAYNEEKLILPCLSSLAAQKSNYPIEIIVSNNNSTDRTQELLDRVGVKSVLEKRQGVGFARQANMDLARGTYMLCADADVLYPPTWADEFVRNLGKKGVAAVYSVDSYIPDGKRTRFGLACYEIFRDISMYLKGFNRPELNVGGGSFGFHIDKGRLIGWKTDIKRGEDGAMSFALKKFGKIKFVNNRRARIWTTTRSIQGQDSLFSIIWKRIKKEAGRLNEYFIPEKKGYKDREENLIK